MKFLADMGISPRTVAHLREQGHDAIHLFDQKLERLTDHGIVEKACVEGRVLLTHDLDFSEIMACSGSQLPSVVTLRLRKMHPDNVNRCLESVVANHQQSLEHGALVSATEGRIRVRRLPV